jgi:hypothetical protein
MRTFARKQMSTQQAKSAGSTNHHKKFFAQERALHSILHLPRTIENPLRLWLPPAGSEEREPNLISPVSTGFVHDFSQISVYPKGRADTPATVSTPGDKYEQEADRVADAVMRIPESQLHRQAPWVTPLMQREAKPSAAGKDPPPIVNDVLSLPGRPLDTATRAFFEPRFGHDLGDVRVFTGPDAARSAQQINARAYNVGRNVVFDNGEYAPNTSSGRALLAHELAHVAQQRVQGIAGDVLFRSENGADATKAEVLRLEEEIKKLAAKNAWSGVARTYESIEKLGDEAFAVASNASGIHMLGAQAARNLGDIRRYKTLLLLAKTSLQAAGGAVDEATLQAVEAELSQIQAAYGVVRIAPRSEPKSAKKKEALRGPELVPAAMPFAQDQRASIEAARQEIAATGYFTGLIPAGDYTLGPESFTVIAGTEMPGVLWGE